MPSAKQLLVVAAFTTASWAASSLDRHDGSFTVEQVANKNYQGPAPLAIQKARLHAKYNKNGIPPSIAFAAAAAASTGTVSATPDNEFYTEYLSPVQIGSQKFSLNFDSGSADLFVLGSTFNKSGQDTYSPGSSSKKVDGETWSVEYGDGSTASGIVYTDTIHVGGTQVVGQDIEVATQASSEFTDTPVEGRLGLSFDPASSCSPKKCPTFMTTAIKNGLPQPLYTAALKWHQPGSFDFGFVNKSKYVGAITYAAVDSSESFWTFTPNGYSIGSDAEKVANASAITGFADTGTSLVYADDSIVSAYYAQVPNSSVSDQYGGYVFPCSTEMPSFSLIIGGYKATIPGQYINYAPVASGSSTCFGGIQSDDGLGFVIYGNVFLISQFVVFDYQGPRLGFAIPP